MTAGIRKAVAWCMGIVLLAGVALAGDAGQEPPFSVGAGARALGLGGGFTSLADDASTLYYNPAGLSLLDYHQVSLMHMTLFEGSIYDYASWVYPTVSLGGFGLGLMRVGTNDIIKREGFVETGSFDYSYSQFVVSYGRQFRGRFAAGASLKIAYQSLDMYSDWGVGLDLGFIARPTGKLSLGLMLRDIVPATLNLKDADETLPTAVAGGIALRDLRLSNKVSALLSFELEKIEERDLRVHSGGELLFDGIYAIRAGYDRDNVVFGAGMRQGRFLIDYAYKVMDYIDDSHRFSLSYNIGASVPEQRAAVRVEEARKGTALLAEERQRQFQMYKDRADLFYHQYRLDSALTYYQRALAFDEQNQEIIGTIAAIENTRRIQQEHEQGLRERQNELSLMIDAYMAQARGFYAKEYYPAVLDMLQLIFEIEPEYQPARDLEAAVYDALSTAIASALEAARQARRDGNTIAAIEAYQRVLYLDPGNVPALRGKEELAKSLDIARHLNTGIDLYKAGRYSEARQQFELVLTVSPTEPVALDYLGRIDKAMAHPPTLDEIQQDQAVWQLYLEGLRYMRNQQYRQAIQAWEKVLEKYPGNEATLDNIEQARLRLLSDEKK